MDFANVNLWLKMDFGRRKVKELEIARLRYDEMGEITNDPIAGVQLIWGGSNIAIIYCRDLEAKAQIVSIGQINCNGQLVQIMNYTEESLKPPERVSIHGIPLHISNIEKQDWISERVTITTPVQYAMKESNGIRINSGNRFCYGHVKTGVIFPRYNNYTTSNPFDTQSLIDYEVTIYINSQPINCARCKDLSHMSRECPKNKPRCRQCGS
ncbi:unnamed protein product, partial [Owenia fusiformis]